MYPAAGRGRAGGPYAAGTGRLAARPRRRSGARVPRPDPAGAENLLRALPPYAAGTLGLVGDLDAMRARVDACAEAGLDKIDLDPVPATAADPAGDRMLTALKPA